jgi:hypothetical protein
MEKRRAPPITRNVFACAVLGKYYTPRFQLSSNQDLGYVVAPRFYVYNPMHDLVGRREREKERKRLRIVQPLSTSLCSIMKII